MTAVDLVIAVHDATRPVDRAVASALASGLGDELRVTVVCHNISVEEIAERMSASTRSAVRFLHLHDGIRSPAGPFNHGIESADAEYVAIMGSDDSLEPGALSAWLLIARRGGAVAVIPPERHASGAAIRTPVLRPWRRGPVDPVRDRLSYRTAPLGLIRREAVARLGLRLGGNLTTGEDQLFGLKLWFSGERIEYARGAPAYLVGADATGRVTSAALPAALELRAVSELLDDTWFRALPTRARSAIAVKCVRVHVFAAAASRSATDAWVPGDREYLAALLARIEHAAPGFARPFAIADRRLIDAIADLDAPVSAVGSAAVARRRFGRPSTLIARNVRGHFAVEGPLRFSVASALH